MNNIMFRIIAGGGIIMNLLGLLIDIKGNYGSNGYYDYNLSFPVHFPYWLFANVIFYVVTIAAALYFSGARFHLTFGQEMITRRPAVKMLGINLILITALLASFLLVSPDKLSHGKLMDVLLNKRVIYLDGGVTQAQAERIEKAIMLLNAQDESRGITIYIYSYGGEIMPGLDIYNMIRNSKTPVTCIVRNKALSIATVILQACDKRMAMEHSHLLIHNVEISGSWHIFEENLEREIEDAKQDQLKINRLLAERSGLPMDVIEELSRKAKPIRPEQAKKLGLIDEII